MGREISNTFLCSIDLNKIVCHIKSRLFVWTSNALGGKSRFSLFVGVTGQDEGIPFHSFFFFPRVLWDGEIGATATAAAPEIYEMEKGGGEGRGWRGTKKKPPPHTTQTPSLFSSYFPPFPLPFWMENWEVLPSFFFQYDCAPPRQKKRGDFWILFQAQSAFILTLAKMRWRTCSNLLSFSRLKNIFSGCKQTKLHSCCFRHRQSTVIPSLTSPDALAYMGNQEGVCVEMAPFTFPSTPFIQPAIDGSQPWQCHDPTPSTKT